MTTTAWKVTRVMQMGMNPYAVCQDDNCEWEHDMSPRTLEMAKLHAETTGHDVGVIREDRSLYRRQERAGRK